MKTEIVWWRIGKIRAVFLSTKWDLRGRLVKMVINEQNLGKGEHNIAVESNDLINGVYLCTLITLDRLISQKVVLVK